MERAHAFHVVRLVNIVQLLQQPGFQLFPDLVEIHLRHHGHQRAEQLLEVLQIRTHHLVDARILNLDRHQPAVPESAPVNLPDGCGGDRSLYGERDPDSDLQH